jgi:RNA ligase-like protein
LNPQDLPPYPNTFKIKRIPIGRGADGLIKKRYLTQEETKELFEGKVIVQEKIDGSQECHRMQYDETKQYVLGGEDMKKRHSILYTRLPAYWILWDIYDPVAKRFLDSWDFLRVAVHAGIHAQVPILFGGETTLEGVLEAFIRQPYRCKWGDENIEGVVIKNYEKQLFGKIVREEFIKGIELEGHWTKRKGVPQYNRLAV